MKKDKKNISLAVLLFPVCSILIMLASCVSSSSVKKDEGVFVKKIEGLSKDFVMGADISSILSLEESGVVFKNKEGNPADIFAVLKKHGISSIRIRVWNNPFDDQGRGFGGGNVDIDRAIEIGKRAAREKMSVMLDFHYSDFWADPSKQQAPRAWQGMSIDEKSQALYEYIKKSILKALDAGVNVEYVQIGNETTGSFCGEKNWLNIAKLMKEGSRAVRELTKEKKKDIKVVLHFTNPEKDGEYERYVQILQKQKVDYDIFASSYYPYWHGTVENFSTVLAKVKELSGKEVMCSEFSYMYTYENADFTGNTISKETMCDKPWPATVQGQATAIREVINAVHEAGGIGFYYWEPSWIGVDGSTLEEQSMLWEQYGSGWASSYASVYDPSDAGKYYGGTSWDNQALFDFDGKPLASLDVFNLVRTGAETVRVPDAVEEIVIRTRTGDSVVLPETVSVIFNDGTSSVEKVTWDVQGVHSETGVSVPVVNMGTNGLAEYFIYGELESIQSDIKPFVKAAIVEKNYLDNSSFEDKDISMWKIVNEYDSTTELFIQEKTSDAKTGNKALHFWSKTNLSFYVEQTVSNLKPGIYNFSIAIHGGDAGDQNMYIYAQTSGNKYTKETNVDGWRNFRNPKITGIMVGDDGKATVGAYVSCSANGWGSLDDFILSPQE
jgi:arabinogalactan endo-1,4-beta-galactosidase